MVELLAPAGSSDSLRAAVNAGADAVYIGGSMFGARAYADNPDEGALIDGIEFCHLHGRKLYMTVNTLLKEKELESRLYDYLLPYYENGVDGLIVQDFGVVRFVQEQFPGLEVHASTQMTVTGPEGARLLQKQGLTRVVPARELSLEEIRRIIDETGIEVETFIHGAMCYCYSGQCLMSSMIGGRSGNRGRCAQPCRLPYTVAEGKTKTSCVLSMKDMCTLDILPDLIDSRIASMKIEGRMKRPEYTAGVVSVYRKYIDLYRKSGRKKYRVEEDDRRLLMDLYNRGGFSKGYYFMHNGPEMMSMDRPNHYGTEALKVNSVSRGKVKAQALEQLHKKDVLEVTPGNEITLNQDLAKGETVTLSVGNGQVHPGMVIRRTKNEWLLQNLSERFLKENVKEKIKGELRILADSPAILKLSFQNVAITVSAPVAERAQNAPTSLESVEKQMRKTGNTPFVFEDLSIYMEDSLFVSIRQLNELRRNGIEKLTEEILKGSRRHRPGDVAAAQAAPFSSEQDMSDSAPQDNIKSGMIYRESENSMQQKWMSSEAEYNMQTEPMELESEQTLKLNILVTSKAQLQPVLESAPGMTDIVYLDLMVLEEWAYKKEQNKIPRNSDDENFGDTVLEELRAKDIRCFLNFPPVFRKKERSLLEKLEKNGSLALMDGFLLHTIDELSWAREYQHRSGKNPVLAADDNFYTYNRRAASFLKEQGISQITLPAELNFRELSQLETKGEELNVYGYQALMQSAQCVTKNTKGCTKVPAIILLRDRKRAEFPVLNRCNICCNTIYNSVPLQLGDCRAEIEKLAVGSVRLSFTIESGSETKEILKQYSELLWSDKRRTVSDLEGTRGHFRRGVE